MQTSAGSSVSIPLPAASASGISLVESNTLAQFASERVAS
jgi:hypothetical protein